MSFDVILWVMHNSDETLGRRLVLLALAENANDDGSGAWPSVETLAKKSRLSTRQVKRCLKGLAGDGAILEEGTGPKGTTSWCVVMGDISDKLSPPDVDKLSKIEAESGQIVTRTCPSEPVLPPVGPPGDVQQVFEFWQRAMDHPSSVLSPDRERVITRALKVATVDECKRAIVGVSRSDYHMARGRYRGGTRYDQLSLVLRNREFIEKYMAMAPANSAGDDHGSSALAVKIREAKRNVLAAFDLAGSAEAQSKGDESELFLAEHGIRVVRGLPTERPAFSGPDKPGP